MSFELTPQEQLAVAKAAQTDAAAKLDAVRSDPLPATTALQSATNTALAADAMVERAQKAVDQGGD
ncbi:hypothetical protein [Spirillospora sp. CA-128828]|uniref:hypothetical protein n=1 Tax=Spirillospora sp. CA-128828 TaxID=3240033 RepID=UPI003D909CEC